jgi:monoamine oxidase
VPLGVLQAGRGAAGAIEFDPRPKGKMNLLKKFRMGHVVKMTLVFRKRCWPREFFGFIHAPGCDFPTLWMARGSRQIVAWAGGDQTESLREESASKLTRRALKELAEIFDLRQRALKDLLVAAHTHDWTNDPFSRGAYSYPTTGSGRASKKLGGPVAGTLYFAGEHFAPPGEEGTVHGAIASGCRAAQEMLKIGGG